MFAQAKREGCDLKEAAYVALASGCPTELVQIFSQHHVSFIKTPSPATGCSKEWTGCICSCWLECFSSTDNIEQTDLKSQWVHWYLYHCIKHFKFHLVLSRLSVQNEEQSTKIKHSPTVPRAVWPFPLLSMTYFIIDVLVVVVVVQFRCCIWCDIYL